MALLLQVSPLMARRWAAPPLCPRRPGARLRLLRAHPAFQIHLGQASSAQSTAFGRAVPPSRIVITYVIIILAVKAVGVQVSLETYPKLFGVGMQFINITTIGALALGVAATPRRYRPPARQTKEGGDWLAWLAWLRRAPPHGVCRNIHDTSMLPTM
jgi:hypothetical protein